MNSKEKRKILAEDLYDIQVVSGCQISPDGRNIVYCLSTVDKENEKKYTHLWMVSPEGGSPMQLTFGKHSDTNPKWSPDSQWIAFLSKREDDQQQQIYLLPLTAGEARPLTDLEGDISDFSWSPDSQKLVFQFRQHDEEDIQIQKDPKKKDLGRTARRISNRVFFKLDAYGYLPSERYHLWLVDIETGETQQITNAENNDETGPVWSPDGQKIAYFSNRTKQPDLNPGLTDLFIYDIENEQETKIETPEGPKGQAAFSPDSMKLAYVGHEETKAGYRNNELWVVRLNGKKEPVSLTAAFDYHVGGGVINDIGSVNIESPVWAEDQDKIYFQVGRHGKTSLHAVDLATKTDETILEFEGVVSAFSMDDLRNKMVYIHGSMLDPGQIHIFDLQTQEDTQLTTLNQALFDNLDLGTFEEVWFEGADGNDLQGWILKPPNFDPNKTYPSIMEIHGGPLTQYGFFFMHEFFYLAAHDYIVYFCNPRGGQGYGEEHAKSIYYGKWGTVDYEDLMAWADFIQEKPYIDPKRMGVTGGSYGGYMTVWIIGHTHRFKAAAAQRSVSNLLSMWGSSDFNWSFQSIFDDKAPYENLEVLWQCSPIKHIGTAKTPTLLIHSMKDLRCAMEQTEQVYVALKNLGVDTELLIFPDSPHGLSRAGRTDRRIMRLKAILNWFEKYLKV